MLARKQSRTFGLHAGARQSPGLTARQHPQPLAQAGEQRREDDLEREELDAAREWLRHVEAGRLG